LSEILFLRPVSGVRFHHQANERIQSNNKILIIINNNYRIQIRNTNRTDAQKRKKE